MSRTPSGSNSVCLACKRASRLSGSFFEFLGEKWSSVLFSAALAVILEHLGFLRVFSKVSLLVVSNLASQGVGSALSYAPGMPVVVVVSAEEFNNRYAERNPLNRCVLGADIARILAKSPRRLAIDFDLSPMAAASAEEQRCQTGLDALLDQHAEQLVLLVPMPAMGDELFAIKYAWIKDRCRARLHFADGTIDKSMGMVSEQIVGEEEELGARMANQLHSGYSSLICDSVLQAEVPRDNPWLSERSTEPDAEAHTQPVNFVASSRQIALVSLGTGDYDQLPSLSESVVLFGGDWGKADSFLTAIGTLPGVVVHAARLISLQSPIISLPSGVGLMIDMGIALCFAWVIDQFWANYVRARKMDIVFGSQGRSTGLSTLVMFTFVCVYLVLVLYFFFAAQYSFSHWNVVIAPLLIALSMLVDGFVSGPVDAIEHLLHSLHSPSRHADAGASADLSTDPRLGRSMLYRLLLTWLLLLAYVASAWAMGDAAQAVSAVSFVAILAVCYLVLAVHPVLLMGRHFACETQGKGARAWLQDSLQSVRHCMGSVRYARFGVDLVYIGVVAAWTRKWIFWFTVLYAARLLWGH